jgi:hypothetical protein
MRIKNSLLLILIVIFMSCDGISHDKTTITLKGFQNQKEIVYETSEAKIYVGYKDLIEYFKNEGINDSKSEYSFFQTINDSTYNQLIRYTKSFKDNSISIQESLATEMIPEKELMPNDSNKLIRIRDFEHPYGYMSKDIRLIIIEFAYNGKLKIFDKNSNSFVEKIIIDIVDTESEPPYSNVIYTGIYITLTNGRILFSEPLGIKS